MSFANLFVRKSESTDAADTIRSARSRAVRSALMSVASVHPEYAGMGFRELLMTDSSGEIMEPFFRSGTLPTTNALLTAWAAQFPYSAESKERAVANIAPIVKEFVYVLASEASSIPVSEEQSVLYATPGYVGAS